MAQLNQQDNSFASACLLVKPKRGRPRKDDIPGSEPGRRTQRRRRTPIPSSGQGLVGQSITGILDGVFDAGFLITVWVGNNGPLLRGMVFDSRLSVPISAGNDVAPQIKMSDSDEIQIPVVAEASSVRVVEPLQRREHAVPSPNTRKVVSSDGSHGSGLRFKGSEAVISGRPPAVSKEAAPLSIRVSEHEREGSAGGTKLDSTSRKSPRPHVPPPEFKPELEDLNDGSDRPKSSTAAAAAQASTSQAISEILQVTKTNPIGNGSSQVPFSGAA